MPTCTTCKKPIEWPKDYVPGNRPLEPGTTKTHFCEDLSELRPLERELRAKEAKEQTADARRPITEPEFESADLALKHDFSFRSLELTIGKTRKISANTHAGLPQYESIEFSIYQKFQVDYTTDIPRLIKETWAKMALQIEREITAEGERLNP